jgi:hypothetical protein
LCIWLILIIRVKIKKNFIITLFKTEVHPEIKNLELINPPDIQMTAIIHKEDLPQKQTPDLIIKVRRQGVDKFLPVKNQSDKDKIRNIYELTTLNERLKLIKFPNYLKLTYKFVSLV